jgi:hypothetical protein
MVLCAPLTAFALCWFWPRVAWIRGQELSYAEVKAIASGNLAVLTLAETDAELQRLAVLKKQHTDEQYLARVKQRELPGTIKKLEQRIEELTQDLATAKAHARDPLVIGERRYADKEAVEALATASHPSPTLFLTTAASRWDTTTACGSACSSHRKAVTSMCRAQSLA